MAIVEGTIDTTATAETSNALLNAAGVLRRSAAAPVGGAYERYALELERLAKEIRLPPDPTWVARRLDEVRTMVESILVADDGESRFMEFWDSSGNRLMRLEMRYYDTKEDP